MTKCVFSTDLTRVLIYLKQHLFWFHFCIKIIWETVCEGNSTVSVHIFYKFENLTGSFFSLAVKHPYWFTCDGHAQNVNIRGPSKIFCRAIALFQIIQQRKNINIWQTELSSIITFLRHQFQADWVIFLTKITIFLYPTVIPNEVFPVVPEVMTENGDNLQAT